MFKRSFSVKTNALSSLVGNVCAAILNIAAVPFYLHYIGIESYGLIGVFTTLQSLISLLDLGISSTINRELARLSGLSACQQEMRDITKTLSVPNWITAGAIALFLVILSPFVASYWIQPKNLSLDSVTEALSIIGVNIAIQFSINFYVGGLVGLQKQVVLNIINVFCSILRTVGSLMVLILVSKTVAAFLLWQSVVMAVQLVLMMFALSRSLPDAGRGRFRWNLFGTVWRFAAGVTSFSVINLILTQTDKVILSRMLDLDHFGYYMLASTIATASISIVVGSLSHAVYPEFARLVPAQNEPELSRFYHQCSQTLTATVFPITAVIVFFSFEILFVWTGNRDIADNSYLILSLIALGTGLNASMWLLHFLQLAHGWTSLIFKVGVALVLFVIPAIIVGVYTYGAIGGAAGWAVLTTLFIPIMVHMMHAKILKGEKKNWYLHDFFTPLLVAGAVAGVARLFAPVLEARLWVLVELCGISAVTLILTLLSTKATRNFVLNYWQRALHIVRFRSAS